MWMWSTVKYCFKCRPVSQENAKLHSRINRSPNPNLNIILTPGDSGAQHFAINNDEKAQFDEFSQAIGNCQAIVDNVK